MKKLVLLLLAALLLTAGCSSRIPSPEDPDPAPVTVTPVTAQVPVLLYHAFCQTPAEAASYTWVSVPRLEEQLAALQAAGYCSVTLAQLVNFVQTGAHHGGRRLPQHSNSGGAPV